MASLQYVYKQELSIFSVVTVEAILTLFFVYNAVERAEHSWKWSVMTSGTFKAVIYSLGMQIIVFSWWLDWLQRHFFYCFLFVALCIKLNIVESET